MPIPYPTCQEGNHELRGDMPKTVIVIHGVGQAAPSEIGRAVAQSLGFRSARQTTVYADRQVLMELTDEATGDSVIEVNWADLLQPKSTSTGLLRHICYLVTSMLDVNVRDIKGKFRPRFGWLYRLVLLTITPGAVLFTLATATAVSVESDWRRWLILLSLLFASVFVAVWLRKLGQHFIGLLLWGATIAAITSVWFAAFFQPILATHQLVTLSGKTRALGFAGVILTLFFAVVECVVRWWKQPFKTKLAYMALLYLPFIVMNGLMSWLGVLALSFISGYSGYQSWEAALWSAADSMTNRRWALIEVATTVVIGGLGTLSLLLPAIGYLVGAGTKEDPLRSNRRGRGAQNGMTVFLSLVPIGLMLLLVFMFCVTNGKFSSLPDMIGIPENIKILDIYQTSVLRTLPYLAWLVGPFALVLDVLGDVLFYLQPNERHPAAIAKRCKERLVAAINFAEATVGEKPERKVVVLAHSQGSVIASDLRAEGKCRYPLVTAGSPIYSLYFRFLGIENEENPADGEARWINCYREGDVIAGPIERPGIENKHMGSGGHTNYWLDKKLADIILDVAERPKRAIHTSLK
jgi:hypothetical protein